MLNIYLTSFHMILSTVTQKADALIFALALLSASLSKASGLSREKRFSLNQPAVGGDVGLQRDRGPEGASLKSDTAGDGRCDGSRCSLGRDKLKKKR